MIAFAVRLLATVIVLVSVGGFAFLSGWVVVTPERPGVGRHKRIDWACPSCNVWSMAYVSRFWRTRALRRALGLSHRRLSPRCRALDRELLIVDIEGARDIESSSDHERGGARPSPQR